MRWGFPLAAAALFLLSAGDLSAQSRAAMTVSVTVVRSAARTQSTATATVNGTATIGGADALPAGSAENPRPASPRETEAEVHIPMPSSTNATTSVMMMKINY